MLKSLIAAAGLALAARFQPVVFRRPTLIEFPRPAQAARRGPGWSTAKVRRMAVKRRNVLKNRRAQRRAGR